MILHLRIVQIIKKECRAFLNDNGVVSAVKWGSCFKSDLVLNL